ncbi:hypothetical protein Peur_008961 [Populus x canadensis]
MKPSHFFRLQLGTFKAKQLIYVVNENCVTGWLSTTNTTNGVLINRPPFPPGDSVRLSCNTWNFWKDSPKTTLLKESAIFSFPALDRDIP